MKLIFILSCVLIICAISVHSEELEASVGETNKFEEAPENDEEVDINWFELQHETIEQQADQPTSGEQFIAIRIGAAGNKDQVNPNLEGLVRIATQFLPNTYTFINVESASREVVAGIKYELLINALDENKSEVLCEIRILEQPWIITSENEKLRTLMYSNCSTDGPYSNEPRGKDVQHSINPIFNNEDKVMTEARLKDMESLIIIPTGNKTPKPPQAALPERLEASVPQPKEDEDGITVVTLSKGTSTFLDDFFSVGKIENKPVQGSVIENEVIPKVEAPARIEATPNRGDSENTFYQVAPNQNVVQPVTSSPETSSHSSAIQVTNNEIPLNREVLQVTCAKIQTIEETSEIKPVSDKPLESRDGNIESSNLNVNVERQKRATDGIDPMVPEKRLLKKLLNAALARLDRYDEDDNKRIFLSVLASSVRGKLFTMDVRVADTKCSESTISAKYCKSQIIDDSIKVCRFEIENLDNGDIKLKKSECVPDNREKRQLAGGARPANEAEHQLVLEFLNEALATGDKQGYSLERVIDATVQTVAGKLYKVKAEFTVDGSTKVCNVEIWNRPWLGKAAREVTFECDTPARRKRQTLGGVSAISHSEVQPILNEVLSEGDYQSYRLVRIIEATKQMVAGISYAIKAEFTVEGESRTCSLTIWDRPWLGKSARVVEFKECDGESVARAKRQAAPPGSQRSVNQEEYPKIEEMLNTALASGDRQNFRLARILHVTKQLSSGWTYKIRGAFEVDGVIKRCNIKLWNRPWLSNAATVESFKCDEHDEHTIRSNHDEKIKRTLDLYLHGNFSDNKIFEIYERLYNKNYPTALSRNMRLRIFKTNLRKIRDLNQNERGTATYGITEFADLTSTEYRMRTGLLRKTSHTNHISNPIAEIPNIALPREFDWRTRGAVSQVKNQGSCGSCWAFSVIGNIEGIHAIKTGVLEEYSEQELVDCDTLDQGCNGGLPDDAYKAIEQLGGLETEKDYPYTARRGHCSFNSTKVKTQIKGAVDLPKNETAIAQWLLQNGPVSIGINANAMQFYRGGVSHPWHVLCNKSDLDHGVLIVGFGVHDYPKFNKTLPYWTIKNSWGPRWGEQGYYRVYRGDNTCGVSEMVSSAVLE